MKEMILKALVQGIGKADRAEQVCRWIKQLLQAGQPAEGRWIYTPSEEELQGWLGGQRLAQEPDVEVCRRLAFRPLRCERVPSGGRGLMLVEWSIGLEELPPVMLYRGAAIEKLLMQGMVPHRVVWQGEVWALQDLGRRLSACSTGTYAVIDDELARRLHLSLPARHTVRQSPLQQCRCMEQLLRQLFFSGSSLSDTGSFLSDTGSFLSDADTSLSSSETSLSSGENTFLSAGSTLSSEERTEGEDTLEVVSVKGCPLSLCLRLQEVPPHRLHRVDEALRMRCFGEQGEALCPADGCREYGLWRTSAYSRHRLVVLYPQGALQQARALFGQLCMQSMPLPLWWQTEEAQWAAYKPGEDTFRQLEEALRKSPWSSQPEEVKVYCLLVAEVGAGQSPAGTPLDVRLRRVARLAEERLMEPVPLHAVGRETLAGSLESQLLRLSIALGGLPWRLHPSAPHDAIPVAGVATGDDGSGARPSFAFSVWKAGAGRCQWEIAGQFRQLVFQLGYALQACCTDDTGESPCRQLLVCVPAGIPESHLPLLHQAVRPLLSRVSVVLAFCRLTSGQPALCAEPDAPQGVPAVGTCVSLLTGEHLLHCRAADGRGGLRRAAPLAVRFCRLTAAEGEGAVQPLPMEPADRDLPLLLEQVCRSVWSNPSQMHGSGLPWVLQRARHLLHDYLCDLRDGLRY